jgi:hypothetical protein
MSKKTGDLKIDVTPKRATFTMAGLVVLDVQIGLVEMNTVSDIIGLALDESGRLDATLYGGDDDRCELVAGDEQSGTFLTIHFEAPPEYGWCEFKLALGQARLASIWRQAKDRIAAQEQAAETRSARAMVALLKAALMFAAGEGGSPAGAFEEWLSASGRLGRVSMATLPIAA